MRPSTWRLDDLRTVILNLGYVGENEHRTFNFDCKKMFGEYPSASVSLTVQPPAGDCYLATVERDGDLVSWTVTDSDLIEEGCGEIQLTFMVGEVVAKTCIGRTKVERSLGATGDIPTPIENWIEQAEEVISEAEAATAAAEAAAEHQPIIDDNGYWAVWDAEAEEYAATEYKAQGTDGHDGVGIVSIEKTGTSGLVDTYTITFTSGDPVTYTVTNGRDADPAEIIDDEAGSGDTDKVWSADKSHALLTEINSRPETKSTTKTGVDLDVTDEQGNVLVRFYDGHIKTENFDSSSVCDSVDVKDTSKTGVDLDVTDQTGNVILRLENGHIHTKNFKSENKEVEVKTTDEKGIDLDLTDIAGNVILRIKDSEIFTKKLKLTNEFYVPEYYFPYIDKKCERISELMRDSGGDAFFFVTDQHPNQGNAHQSFKLINYIAKKCRINKLFLGGDLDNGINEQWADEFRRAIGGRMYACCGNHEYMNYQGVTNENLEYALCSATDDEIKGDPLRRYFYVDNPKKKVRYIVLNGFDENSTSTSWSQGYEQDQEDWLTDVALVVESDWTIIVVAHAFWDVADMRYPVLTQLSWTKHILDAIDGSSYAGNVACILTGHSHMDAIEATDGGIPALITTCDKYGAYDPEHTGQEYWLENRVPGTVTEQAFEVCVLDTKNKKLTAVRVGGFNTGNSEQDEALFEAGEQVINYGTEGN